MSGVQVGRVSCDGESRLLDCGVCLGVREVSSGVGGLSPGGVYRRRLGRGGVSGWLEGWSWRGVGVSGVGIGGGVAGGGACVGGASWTGV